MKTKFLLTLILMSASVSGFCTNWTITNSGTTFTPNSLTINLGDSVNFVLAAIHNSIEVSQATWNANGNTPLPGGFSNPNGGGQVLPAFLTVGTHYYVCGPHASLGMKGVIIVNNLSGIAVQEFQSNVSLFPNPSNGKFQLLFGNPTVVTQYNFEIYDLQGQTIYKASDLVTGTPFEIDLADLAKGIYIFRISGESGIFNRKIIVQ